ncbi:MAG: hypothetical protein KBB55_04165 [Candidatus Buchananbacteria bacterium]|nr:hypothetical protein [Candidatus Buchananbacteria bacterium]
MVDMDNISHNRDHQIALVEHTIKDVYRPFLAQQSEILERKESDWIEQFKQSRLQAMEALRKALPSVLQECPDLLKTEDWCPRISSQYKPRDFRSTLVVRDPISHVYLVSLILDPGQGSSPHEHNSPFFVHLYKGSSIEYTFDNNYNETGCFEHKNGTTTPIHGYGFPEADLHTVYNPHTLPHDGSPSTENMTVQLHLYDGFDHRALEEGSIVSLMPAEKDFPSSVARSLPIEGHIDPVTRDLVRKPCGFKWAYWRCNSL